VDQSRPDFFVSTEEPVEVDAETAAALERSIKEADEGRLVSSDEVRKRMAQWFSKSSIPVSASRS
jgi:predicted transcriptional regulator